ncbi:MAG: Mu transposase domain-containing protein [Methylococcales bacterium]
MAQSCRPCPTRSARSPRVRASKRFRVTLDSNRYSVPSEYASTRLTLKAYPDHPGVCLIRTNGSPGRCAATIATWILTTPTTPAHCWHNRRCPGPSTASCRNRDHRN